MLKVASTLTLLVIFALACAGSLLAHSNVPVVRGLVAQVTSRLLSELFEGRMVIPSFEQVSATELKASYIEVQDAAGKPLLKANNVNVQVSLLDILGELFLSRDRFTTVVQHVRIERTELDLTMDPETGRTTLELALTPVRKPASPRDVGEAPLEPRLFSVWLPVIELGKVQARLNLGQAQALEAQVHHAKGRVIVEPTGVEVAVERFALGVLGLQPGELRGTGTTELLFPGSKTVEFQGALRQLEFQARLRQTGNHVTLTLDIPRAEPSAIKPLIVDWPIREPASAQVKATGVWPSLETTAQINLDSGATLDAEGTVNIDSDPDATLNFFVGKLDLRSFWEAAPATDLTINGRSKLSLRPEGVSAEFSATTGTTTIGQQEVPSSEITGTLDHDGFVAEARLLDTSMPATLRIEAKDQMATLRARLPRTALQDLGVMPEGVSGTASLVVDATVKEQRLDWSAQAEVDNLRMETVSVGHAALSSKGHALLSELPKARGTLDAKGTKLVIGKLQLQQFDLRAEGPWNSPRIVLNVQNEQARRAELAGHAVLTPHFVLRDLKVRVSERDLLLTGNVNEFRPSEGLLEIEDLSLTGAGGTLKGWLRYRPGLLETDIEAQQLDLVRISSALGLEQHKIRGKVDLDLDLAAGQDVTRGRLVLTLVNGSWGGMGSTTLRTSSHLKDTELSVEFSGIDPLVGTFGAQANLHLAGSVLEVASFQNATGTAQLRVNDVPLDPVSLILPKDSPLRGLTGRGAIELQVESTTPKSFPKLSSTVTLTGLGVEVQPRADQSFVLTEGELHSSFAYDPESATLSGAVALFDHQAEMIAASGTMTLDAKALIDQPDQALPKLLSAPIDLVVSVTPTPIARLPFEIEGVQGLISARATLRGSLTAPHFTGTLTGTDIVDASSPLAVPLNVLAHGEYLPRTGQASAQASVSQGTVRVANILAEGRIPPVGSPATQQTMGRMEAHLHALPLQVMGPLAEGNVKGNLSGALRFVLQPGGVELRAMLSPREVSVLGTDLGDGTLTLDGTQNQIHGQLELKAPKSSVNAGILLDFAPEQYLRSVLFDINANNLEASILEPVLEDVVQNVAGSLDVQGRLATSRTEAAAEWQTKLDGLAKLNHGTAHFQVLGLELNEIECTLSARSLAGKNVISLSGVKAKARSSAYNVKANVNLTLAGVRVVGGEAQLSINEFPFMLEAVTRGWGTGSANAVMTRKPDHMLVEVNVERLTTRLPSDLGREVFGVQENPDFHVVQSDTHREQSSPLPWRFVINLGPRTRVVRGTMNLLLTGIPQIDLGEQVLLSGNLQLLPGGRIHALGKPFVIEHGTISLNPADATNPTLDLRAAWRAPDGVTIYALAHGPYRDLNDVELGSDAGLSREEIWARITGSSSSVATSSSEQDKEGSTVGAVGAAGLGAAALGVNELVGDTLSDVEIRVDPGENTSYAAAVRLTEKLWFEGRYQRDEAAASVGGPSNVVSGAFDYRFARKWSLRTELGNAGGTFDLLWQHRY